MEIVFYNGIRCTVMAEYNDTLCLQPGNGGDIFFAERGECLTDDDTEIDDITSTTYPGLKVKYVDSEVGDIEVGDIEVGDIEYLSETFNNVIRDLYEEGSLEFIDKGNSFLLNLYSENDESKLMYRILLTNFNA